MAKDSKSGATATADGAGDGAKTDAKTDAADPGVKRRVICNRRNASKEISGVAFATVKLGDQTVHVSEHIADDAMYKRFLSVDGYEPFTGDEAEYARTIEDALTASRQAPAVRGSALHDFEREREEARRANASLVVRLQTANKENARLAKENDALKAENAALKMGVARAAAPVPAAVQTV